MGVELPAAVVPVGGNHQVASQAVVVGAVLAHPAGGIGFDFVECLGDRFVVNLDEPPNPLLPLMDNDFGAEIAPQFVIPAR